ncbi:hypothetical protein ACDF64_13135 [Agromyces sp. MMS24-JH15]|uniref:hypothetical protein n=1 Tax=Agromyces sp. MMS24-JH15 TaxID=3243765 RepID=UPI00374877A9
MPPASAGPQQANPYAPQHPGLQPAQGQPFAPQPSAPRPPAAPAFAPPAAAPAARPYPGAPSGPAVPQYQPPQQAAQAAPRPPVAPGYPYPQQAPQGGGPTAARPAPAPVPGQAAPGQPAPGQPAQWGPPQAAPRPAPTPAAAPPQQPRPERRAPERTLTRRELRALIDAQHPDAESLLAELEDLPDDAPAPAPALRTDVAPQVDRPAAPTRSGGHWADRLEEADEPDASGPFDQLLSRGAGSHGVPTTTNALILPTLPDLGPLAPAQPGEVIVTGTIDLPRSLGSTGIHPSQMDSTDIDRLFEHVDDDTTGVAPVAATKAISTQGGPRSVITPPQKERANLPLILAITAGVLALGVVATLVIGAVAGLF